MKTKEKLNELKIDYAKYSGVAEVLKEIEDIETIDELKEYIEKKTRQFWDESTPIATEMCTTLIKMGEEYVKGESPSD